MNINRKVRINIEKYNNLSEEEEYISNLPYHLMQAGLFDDYYDLLNEDEFLEFKLEVNGINSYDDDLQLALPRIQDWQNLGFKKKIDVNSLSSMNSLTIFIAQQLCRSQNIKIINKGSLDLQLIAMNIQFPDVVFMLKKCFQNENNVAYKACRRILWRYAQNMSYPEFFSAWHT